MINSFINTWKRVSDDQILKFDVLLASIFLKCNQFGTLLACGYMNIKKTMPT